MENKNTKTVINIGWNAVGSSLMKNFSEYAAKGYILSEMNDSVFVFVKSAPVEAEFMLYEGSADENDKKYAALAEGGYTILCSHNNYHILTIPKDKAEMYEKNLEKRQKLKMIAAAIISALLLAAALLFIPNDGVLKSIRTVLSALFSGGVIFFWAKLSAAENEEKQEKNK